MQDDGADGALELWGGLECTLNRVGDRYFDQLVWSGHAARASDLDLFASLGLRRLRYPILWERTIARNGYHWQWADERLTRLRQLDVEPIVGLLHHGSGPPGTSLLDSGFVDAFVSYARAFARRYPWIRIYTPINEPLTTARFAALYGHWHPHTRDDRCFARALVQQLRATVMAMKAIREIRPDAVLMQTEDVGTITSTAPLRYQADFENERRWLTWDLLCGSIVPGHPLWKYLQTIGVDANELAWFADHHCRPDLLGVNHYVTSDRFLDHRTTRYPPRVRGGNHDESYADVETVRVSPDPPDGIFAALRSCWRRYQQAIVVSEAHLACTREEQVRWLHEIWHAAHAVRREGVKVKAVTAWALLGAFNWRNLVTRDEQAYDAGVFDVRTGGPRPTALATLVRAFAQGRDVSHPVLSAPGWWRRDVRLCAPAAAATATPKLHWTTQQSILIIGPPNDLTTTVIADCELRALFYCWLSPDDERECARRAVRDQCQSHRPWAVVDTTEATGGDQTAAVDVVDILSSGGCLGVALPILRIDTTARPGSVEIFSAPVGISVHRQTARSTPDLVALGLDLLIDHAFDGASGVPRATQHDQPSIAPNAMSAARCAAVSPFAPPIRMPS